MCRWQRLAFWTRRWRLNAVVCGTLLAFKWNGSSISTFSNVENLKETNVISVNSLGERKRCIKHRPPGDRVEWVQKLRFTYPNIYIFLLVCRFYLGFVCDDTKRPNNRKMMLYRRELGRTTTALSSIACVCVCVLCAVCVGDTHSTSFKRPLAEAELFYIYFLYSSVVDGSVVMARWSLWYTGTDCFPFHWNFVHIDIVYTVYR